VDPKLDHLLSIDELAWLGK
jgi:hypothetical protein